MNRQRLLKQRIRRCGDVAIFKMDGGFVVATGRFQGDCSDVLSKRQAIQMAARWALPSAAHVVIVEQGGVVTTHKQTPHGVWSATVA